MQVLFSFLKLGFHWTLPRDCTVGTSLGGTTREILEGFPGRVLSKAIEYLGGCVACQLHRVQTNSFESRTPLWIS